MKYKKNDATDKIDISAYYGINNDTSKLPQFLSVKNKMMPLRPNGITLGRAGSGMNIMRNPGMLKPVNSTAEKA